jgi:hypothetical protein
MTTHNTGRGLALVAGTLATAGALAILLQDAIRSGHWTIEHGLIPVLMAVQILTGHLFVAAARQRKALPALGFAVVAMVATWGVLDTSVAKQGAVQAEAVAKAEDVNARRSGIERQIADAEAMLGPCPSGSPKDYFGNRCGLNASVVAECASGDGKRCKGKQASQALYQSALRTYRDDLAKLGPQQAVDARSENMATLIAALTGRDKTKIKHVLATIRPFTYALIFELAALVSFGFAFGHRPATVRPANENRPATWEGLSDAELATIRARFLASDTVPDHPKPGASAPLPSNVIRLPDAKSAALARIRTDLADGRTFPSQADLCRTFGVPRSTMSDWLTEWEGAGQIPARRIVGRCKEVGA